MSERQAQVYFAPYREFGIPPDDNLELEAPPEPVMIRAIGYQDRQDHLMPGDDRIVIYYERHECPGLEAAAAERERVLEELRAGAGDIGGIMSDAIRYAERERIRQFAIAEAERAEKSGFDSISVSQASAALRDFAERLETPGDSGGDDDAAGLP